MPLELARRTVLPEGARPCVWMAAGVVRYKLCDRDFDCEHCALDAGLRGDAVDRAPLADGPRLAPWTFPEDRRYSHAHLWTQQISPNRVRLGLDALAARLLGSVHVVYLPEAGIALQSDEPIVHFGAHAGHMTFRAPVGGSVTARNDVLSAAPERVIEEPYGGGWLVELVLGAGGLSALDSLCSAAEIEQLSRIELRRIWRQIGMSLLITGGEQSPPAATTRDSLEDARRLLGETRYFELVHEALQ